jgi:hypothetical protein
MRRLSFAIVLVAGCSGSSQTMIEYAASSQLMPGEEIERCKLFQAPPEGMYIQRESVHYTPGSHHVLLYTLTDTTLPTMTKGGTPIDNTQVNDCKDGAGADYNVVSVVAGAQSADAPDIVNLPSGYAIHIPGNTVLVLDMHYLNASPNALTTDVKVDVYTVKETDVKTAAGIIFFYDPIIRVPAMGTAQARMSCPVHGNFEIFNLQSHMHRRGVGYTANLTDDTANILNEMYTSNSWENVKVQNYSPTLKVQSGQRLDYRCQYDNPEDRVVLQGLTTKDEMCMLIGAYAPQNDAFQYCSAVGAMGLGSAATFYGNGSASCMDTVNCAEQIGLKYGNLRGSGASDALYQCVLNSCEKAGPAMTDVIKCEVEQMQQSCSSQCSANAGSTDCVNCLHTNCSTEMGACQASACN